MPLAGLPAFWSVTASVMGCNAGRRKNNRQHMQTGVDAHVRVATLPVQRRRYRIANRQRTRFGNMNNGIR